MDGRDRGHAHGHAPFDPNRPIVLPTVQVVLKGPDPLECADRAPDDVPLHGLARIRVDRNIRVRDPRPEPALETFRLRERRRGRTRNQEKNDPHNRR